VLIDTAGRHNLDRELAKEIKDLNKYIKPTESILVMPADIGQAAKKQAQEFKDAVNISGVIITRMDSSAKSRRSTYSLRRNKSTCLFYWDRGENKRLRRIQSKIISFKIVRHGRFAKPY